MRGETRLESFTERNQKKLLVLAALLLFGGIALSLWGGEVL